MSVDKPKSNAEYVAEVDEVVRKANRSLSPLPAQKHKPAKSKTPRKRDIEDQEVRRKAFYDMIERQAERDAKVERRYIPPRDDGEGATPQRIAQAKGEFEEVNTETEARHTGYTNTVRMLDGSILDRLASRGSISGDQYHAGVRFYRDWYASGLAASGVVDVEKPVVDNSPKPDPVARLDAATRYAQAVKALGISNSNVLTSVVLSEEPPAQYGHRRFGYKDAKAALFATIGALKCALDELDWHYHGKRRSHLNNSHVSDYRPTIRDRSS